MAPLVIQKDMVPLIDEIQGKFIIFLRKLTESVDKNHRPHRILGRKVLIIEPCAPLSGEIPFPAEAGQFFFDLDNGGGKFLLRDDLKFAVLVQIHGTSLRV
jgi:hypothetical protein